MFSAQKKLSKTGGSFILSFTSTVFASNWLSVSFLFKEFLLTFCENEIFVTIKAFYLFIYHV